MAAYCDFKDKWWKSCTIYYHLQGMSTNSYFHINMRPMFIGNTHPFAQVKIGNQSNPHFKIVNDDVYPYQLLIFINSMHYLVSLDQNNN